MGNSGSEHSQPAAGDAGGNCRLDTIATEEKRIALNKLGAFAIATKLYLRQRPLTDELDELVPPSIQTKLTQAKNPPLDILLLLSDYLQRQWQQQRLDSNQRAILTELLNALVEGLTSCERILSTPMPIAYSLYLKRLILIYCGLLPFSLVDDLHWWTALVVALISFVLTGVEEIGNEIEDPFGTDPNDLPLDDICNTVLDTVERTKQFTPMGLLDVLLTNHSFQDQGREQVTESVPGGYNPAGGNSG